MGDKTVGGEDEKAPEESREKTDNLAPQKYLGGQKKERK